jgi:O-Antigen ligase
VPRISDRFAVDLRLLQHVAPCAVATITIAWAWLNGGFTTTTWYLGGLLIAGFLVTQILGGAIGFSRAPIMLAVGLLGAFAAFEGLSILWASSKGDAWDAANLTCVYVFVMLLFSGWRASVPERQLLVALYVTAIAGVGVLTLFKASHDVAGSFVTERLGAPTGYPNASAALFLIPFFPAVALGASRSLAVPVRALAVGAAAALACVAYVPESRGALYMFPLACLLLVCLATARITMIVTLAVALAPTAILIHPLSQPYEAVGERLRAAATHHAAVLTLLAAISAAAAHVLVAIVDRRLPSTPHAWIRRAGLVSTAVVIIAAVAFAAVHHPLATERRLWSSFRSEDTTQTAGSTRFGSLGSHRYDFWRVSLDLAKDHPAGGVGAGNFGEHYLQSRRTGEQPQFPHSVEMSVVSQTGAIGTTLFLLFVAFAALAVVRNRRHGGAAAALGAGGATAFAYWLLHGSVDWLWEFPALGAGAFMLLGIAAGPAMLSRVPLKLPVAVAVITAAIAVSFIAPWASAKQVTRASEIWRADPAAAYTALDQAADLNPLSDGPPVVEGTIAAERGDVERMRASFERAIARDPNNWFSRLQLAVALAQRHRWGAAEKAAEQAARLDPLEPAIPTIRMALRAHREIPLRTVNDAVLAELRSLPGVAR